MEKAGTSSRGQSRTPTTLAGDGVGGNRRYDSSRRQADAAERRRRVIDAAHRLFLENGFGATAIADIAREAGVSTPTVYAQFESKAGILARLIDVAVAGDDEDAGLARDRPAYAHLFDPDLDARARIRALAQVSVLLHRRGARLVGLVASVAGGDAAVGALHARLEAARADDARAVARLFDLAELRPGLDHVDVARIIGAVAGVPVYLMLAETEGLSDTAYGAWLDRSLSHLLLPDT
jgi:AcrR family transcriptional regulator